MSLLAGVTAGVGSLFSSALDYQNAEQNRSHQLNMSSTAHQREVRDLRKAGLNPILSATKTGASTGAGSAKNPTENPVMAGLTAQRIESEIDNIDAKTDLTKAQTNALGPVSELGESAEGMVKAGVESFKNFGEFVGQKAAQGVMFSSKQIDNLQKLWNKYKHNATDRSGKPLKIEIRGSRSRNRSN